MSLWSSVSIRTVLKNLVNGLSHKWIGLAQYWQMPNSGCVRIQKLLRSVSSGMLLMWDRGLHSYKMVNATIKQSCHYLGRLPANVKFEIDEVLDDGSYLSWINPDGKSRKQGAQRIRVRIIEDMIDDGEPKTYRLITSLMDIVAFPAVLLATEYHQRWEIESTIDELKTHLFGRKILVRSLNPREVVQEIYGWLLGHWSIRYLMFQAAESAKISPLRIGFTGTLNVIRRAIPHFQSATSSQLPFFLTWLLREICDERIPARQGRSNPRVVKKRCSAVGSPDHATAPRQTRSKFPAKKPFHRGTGTQHQHLNFSIASTA